MVTVTPLELAAGVIGLLVLIGIAIMIVRGQRRARLRSTFGPEYDRTVREAGSTRRAEAALQARQQRVARLTLRPLTLPQRESFSQNWRDLQTRFVDDPGGAVHHADVLLADVMIARGYPVADFDHRADDLSVDHPGVVEHYRTGHAIALRHVAGEATTEELRHAMLHYRALFDELVNEPGATDAPAAGSFAERLRP